MARSVIRWAGSKRLLLPELRRRAPTAFGSYLEPFAGSCCLFFDLEPKKAILGDRNPDLIAALALVKDDPDFVFRALSRREISSDRYYEVREKFNNMRPGKNRSLTFLYLNRYCFNGVYRTNKSGQFNVPFGSRTGAPPTIENYKNCSRLLGSARLISGDYLSTLKHAKCGDFVYIDPPYLTSTHRYSGEYGYGAFSYRDEDALVEEIRRLDRLGANVLVSYMPENSVKSALGKGWRSEVISVRRQIAGAMPARGHCSEMLMWNFREMR